MKSTAIILAAGQGKRMQSVRAKQYLELNGKPVLYYSLSAFSSVSEIDNIILVISDEDRKFVVSKIIERYHFDKVTDIVAGGLERYHSVANGLKAPGAGDSDYIFIHDGARPLIDADIISRAVAAVKEHPAIVVGMPVKDTIKRVDEANIVCETPDRTSLWAVQTPQVFSASLIKEAYRLLDESQKNGALQPFFQCEAVDFLSEAALAASFRKSLHTITDDAMVVETFTNTKVKLIPGSYRNIKITTPEDLKAARGLL